MSKNTNRLEKQSRARKRRKDLQKIVLETVALSTTLSVALVAPNAIGVMQKLNLLPSPRQKESINRTRDLLIKKGLLARDKSNNLHLTSKGKSVIERIRDQKLRLRKAKKWDKRWRILMFDIPEKKRGIRDKLRYSLRAAGFALFQDSVWVYPYDCEEYIALLKADFKIGKDMRYIIADTIEGDKHLKEFFGVS